MSSSLRKMRRQKERQDRKYAEAMEKKPLSVQRDALFRNGITNEDTKREYLRGRKDGVEVGRDYAFRLMYAATLLALIEDHGMGKDDAVELLCRIDDRITLCIEDTELAEEVYRKYGIELSTEDPIRRIQST